MKKALLSTLILVIGYSSLPLQASYLPFLKDSPVRYFTDSDWKIFDATLENALNHSRNNVKTTWSNPTSGSSGTITPLNTTRQNGTTCRDVKMFSVANHYSGEFTFTFCKYGKEWKVPSED